MKKRKVDLKTELKIFFLLIFIIPILDIILFNATNSLLSALIIIVSLLIFYILAVLNIDNINNRIRTIVHTLVVEEKNIRNKLDLTVSDLKENLEDIEHNLSIIKVNDKDEQNKINSISNNINNMSSRLESMAILEYSGIRIDKSSHEVSINDQYINLTSTEFELLWILMEKKGRVLSRAYLLEAVWGYDYFGNTRSTDIAVARLRKKLAGKAQCIQTVSGVGYKFIKNNN